ncbi:hypothetical protein HJC23_004198 [Cyclotella cryptica]|uniref:Protein HIRA-like C-terminal domain-containing protein n=1 Tax=Cyclotella cryptica TaxID=29204 RepID=A0ABD3Q9V6_9STRA|eukprot:CCRYP_007835-RA/>CCRYP_007835-RA protein AED:0.00 eAED:0.00 QI:248/-1/1/1/-1/1/1/2283/1240
MVLVEIPLWVMHGNPNADKKRSILPTAANVATSNPSDDTPSSKDAKDATQIAKAALSLLPNSNRQQRPPLYGIDVHPDGTRFATASGDGTVKIWSTAALFGGRFDKNNRQREASGRDGRGWGEFTEGGNYVSSNSEGEGYDTCSSMETSTPVPTTTAPAPPQTVPVVGVNDLSGLVRKKKGGGNANPVKNVAAPTKPPPVTNTAALADVDATTTTALESNNSESPLAAQLQPSHPLENKTTNLTNKAKQHKLLTTISSSHTGSILSIRFSPSGQYLATAGDDSYVNIYVKSNTPAFKGNLVGVDSNGNRMENQEDVEHWNRIAIGRGHALDVVGLAWAPDDSHLVSCSLDSVHPVIVWRLFDVLENPDESNTHKSAIGGTNTPQSCGTIHNLHPFKILGRNVHTSTVKGVAFDPAGKYIATSGDDPAICIWRAFDDWGLEARIDSTSGVFRSRKRKRKSGQEGENHEDEDDPGELASLSLFRRISFAPDGSHVCGTNATLRGKNIAAMISREGWAASSPAQDGETKDHPPGAANLVGHKQPVVSSRHCPVFFQVPNGSVESDSEDDPDAEPDYSTLVALGDKKGFVTVWSTKLPRPLFKMQCSESRCTVTDISWGFVSAKNCKEGKDSLVMMVSLLDGYVVAINFTIPDEVGGGSVLSAEKQRQIFRLKYGIDDFVGMYGVSPEKRRSVKRLVDDVGPMLIENALQLTMEMENEEDENDHVGTNGGPVDAATPKGTKKRGRLTSAPTNNVSDEEAHTGDDANKPKKTKDVAAQDTLQNALDAAARADNVTAKAASREKIATGDNGALLASGGPPQTNGSASVFAKHTVSSFGHVLRIPYTTHKIYSVDLEPKAAASTSILDGSATRIVADCVNVPAASAGSLPSATLTISRGGVRKWKDILAQVSCSALAASRDLMAVGTADGCLYLYGTSPTLGWESAKAHRAFPPFVLGSSVVEIKLSSHNEEMKMVVLTSDGNFYVYKFLPLGPKLEYKGSVVPPMQHLLLSFPPSSSQGTTSILQPKLASMQLTDTNQLMLILSFGTLSSSAKTLHGFVYNCDMEVWMRVSDSNSFLVSDFYPPVPRLPTEGEHGLLSRMDAIIRSGASMESAKQMYIKLVENEKQTSQKIVTRSHCEDRLACAIALRSTSEFQTWLSSYARCLSSSGDADALRFLVDILLGNSEDFEHSDNFSRQVQSCWWLNSIGDECLGLNSKDVIRHHILPQMSKNRELQRLTNEIAMELES